MCWRTNVGFWKAILGSKPWFHMLYLTCLWLWLLLNWNGFWCGVNSCWGLEALWSIPPFFFMFSSYPFVNEHSNVLLGNYLRKCVWFASIIQILQHLSIYILLRNNLYAFYIWVTLVRDFFSIFCKSCRSPWMTVYWLSCSLFSVNLVSHLYLF